ncbi:MAG: Zinc uptake regulation protein ZUR [Anaerolineae bacterium]|jgi:Fur family ferric uptake transcriptional regulator|nr:MAG: Zinc uptake regulation protein ZUR [Anaerolineae bacterium]
MKTSSVELIILELLNHERAHLTAQEIYQQLKPRLPAVNPSTVYRALERMAHAGKISVSDMGKGAMVYEAVGGERHHHLVCQDCGAVITIEDGPVSALFRYLEGQHHFEMITNHLILFGRCQACQQSAQTTNQESAKG